MNLAGDSTKRLLRGLRTGGKPTSIGLWAAVTAVDQLRRRRKPEKALLLRKDLEPGATYVVRVPQQGQATMTETLSSGGLGSELLTAAAEFLTTEQVPVEEPVEAGAVRLSRRGRRRAKRLEKLEQGAVDPDLLPRRQRRELRKAQAKARRRPSRRRVKKAGKLQKAAAKSVAKARRKAAPSRRSARKSRKRELANSGGEQEAVDHSRKPKRPSKKG